MLRPSDYDFTLEQLELAATFNNLCFYSHTCSICGKVANIIQYKFVGGYVCICGTDNSVDYRCADKPVAEPDLGPTLDLISQAGLV